MAKVKLTIEFSTGNAAFAENESAEISSVAAIAFQNAHDGLQEVIAQKQSLNEGKIRDYNGNTIGEWESAYTVEAE